MIGVAALVAPLLALAAWPLAAPSVAAQVDTGRADAVPVDAWAIARSAPDGPERTEALLHALAPETFAALAPQARRERLEVAYHAFLSAEERRSGDEMLQLAQAMYGRDAALWSAFCLEGALRRGFGRYAEADALLADLGASLPDPQGRRAVLERRALVAAGAGEAQRERALLGAALAQGSDDARQVLGFAALRAGDRAAARAHFGALLEPLGHDAGVAARDLPPWALRGHAVALLPRRKH